MLHITSRDLTKRLAAVFMILTLCWLAADHTAVLITAAAVLATEVGIQVCARIQPAREDEIGIGLIVAVWGINSVSTIFYLAPTVILAGQPSVPFLLTGFVWAFGVFVHMTNTFVAVPHYNWSQMVPSFATLGVALWIAAGSGFAAGHGSEWTLSGLTLIVYASNTFQTLSMQKDTHRALASARLEANARLRALEHITRHDPLTGLLSRRAFDEDLERMLSRRRSSAMVAVLLIDLDGFKPVNDTYSHEAGDAVLVAIGHRLQALAGKDGIAARLGGDEFAIAFRAVASERAALRLADYVARDIALPVRWGEKELRIAGSIGIGLSGSGGDTVGALCSNADQAMYRAKSDRSGRAVLFDPATFAPRLSLRDRQALIDAMASGQILPHYQPKVRLDTGVLIGFEALARWHHPERGLLRPGEFLPQINELGLQGDFLNHMADRVMADVASICAEGLDPGQVSLNLPEVTLATHSGRGDLDKLLAKYPTARPHLTFEITEDVFITRAGDFIQHSIAHFRQSGVRISLDDFGTGFASFQHLRQLEFDELKIDQSFVSDLGSDPAADILVGGFLSIAAGLNVSVIAEGVETEDQRAQLLRMGCRFGQGYRFGRAAPLDEMRIRLFAERPGDGPRGQAHSRRQR